MIALHWQLSIEEKVLSTISFDSQYSTCGVMDFNEKSSLKCTGHGKRLRSDGYFTRHENRYKYIKRRVRKLGTLRNAYRRLAINSLSLLGMGPRRKRAHKRHQQPD